MTLESVVLLLLGLVFAIVGTRLVVRAQHAVRHEIAHWEALRKWLEYRSQGDRALFDRAANLEEWINRLALSHTEPLRRRLEALEAKARGDGVGASR